MNTAFHDLLDLFACGSTGRKPILTHQLDISEIRRLSIVQGIWPIVFCTLQPLLPSPFIEISTSELSQYKTEVVVNVTRGITDNNNSSMIYRKLREAGIPFCLLKGESLSYLYQNPLYRISTDTDILIPESAERDATQIMQGLGYSVEERKKTSHHVRCYHAQGGLVELHLRLYDEILEDVWFNYSMANQEPYRELTLVDQNITVPVLGITDGFIFTTLHFIKHFLTRGVGIRQMMDLILYVLRHQDEINWNRFDDLMRTLKYNHLLDCIFQIGRDYFMISDLPRYGTTETTLIKRILDDMEIGGLFGFPQSEMSRFYIKYTKERFPEFKQDDDYDTYIREWLREPLRKRLFPGVKELVKKFPYVKRSSLLIPFAWIHRLVTILFWVISNKTKISDYSYRVPESELVERRMSLIKDLGMV